MANRVRPIVVTEADAELDRLQRARPAGEARPGGAADERTGGRG